MIWEKSTYGHEASCPYGGMWVYDIMFLMIIQAKGVMRMQSMIVVPLFCICVMRRFGVIMVKDDWHEKTLYCGDTKM